MLLVAQAAQGRFEAWTVFVAHNVNYIQRQRAGRLVYARDGIADEGDSE